MKKLLILPAFLLFAIPSLSQVVITGTVVDAETRQPIPFAGVSVNEQNTGVTSNAEGAFRITSNETVRFLSVRGFGYDRRKYTMGSETKGIVISLTPSTSVLNEMEVFAGENPLHRIIRKVIANRDQNNPTSLDAFKYETYSKVLFTVVGDTTGPDIDTVFMPLDASNPEAGVNRDSIVRIDSSVYERKSFMNSQHLFIMESITERTYVDPRDNEKVLATKISGLRTPLFVLLATEMQSFSFYDNYIKILGSERVNPVAPGAIGRYVYLPLDTVLDGTDTTFVINYYPVADHRFKGMDGELYITTDGWAVKKVIARPTGQDILGIVTGESTVFGVEIHQAYQKISDHWFPAELSMDFKQFETEDNGASSAIAMDTGEESLYGFGRTRLQNIQINPEIESRDVDRISVAIAPDAADKPDDFWNAYRGDSLDAREQRTYEVVDSIADEFDVETKIKWLLALSTGKIRWGYFDFNIDKILRYNRYEGVRLGVGVQTSPKLSEWFSIGGKVAYGFRDRVWKYGYFGEIYLDKVSEAKFYGGYDFDIYETGGTRFNLKRKTIFGDANYHFLNIPNFEETSDAYLGYSYRIWPNWRADLSFHRQNRYNTGDYAFLYSDEDETVALNGYNVAFLRLEMEYAPNDRYMSGPFGLRALERTYPRFRFAFEEGFDDFFDRNYPFRRFDAQAIHQIRRVYLGTTTFSLAGSYIDGDVPYGLLAGPEANGTGPLSDLTLTNAIASFRSFETMPFNRFAANAYVSFDLRHSFEDRLFSIGSWAPGIDIVYRATYGVLDNPESHIGFELEGVEDIYHEVGVEINRMWEGLGIGFYQRFGPYYVGSYGDNIALKLTYRLSLF